jgi:hypothetical protein
MVKEMPENVIKGNFILLTSTIKSTKQTLIIK